jgi:hypothetical protein
MERIMELEDIHAVWDGLRRWSKGEHLKRMPANGCFRFTREVVVHHVEEGNAERLIGLTRSQGNVAMLLKKGLSERELGIEKLKEVANETLGETGKLGISALA